MHVYEGAVSEGILSQFHHRLGQTLMNHAANTCGIEETLAVAAVFWPTLIEHEGCVFIADFFQGNIQDMKELTQKFERLMQQFQSNKHKIERWVNAWSLSEFFLLAAYSSSVEDDVLLTTFGETLRFFWSLRLKTAFPDKTFVIEIGEGIEGENGLAITFYQNENAPVSSTRGEQPG